MRLNSAMQALGSLLLSAPRVLPAALLLDELDLRMHHPIGIERVPSCAFAPMPKGVNASMILADILPRLHRNELSQSVFGNTTSVKWRFSSKPGALERALDPSTASWAAPLVREWFGGTEADLFLLNGLSVPCGASVAAHYDGEIGMHFTQFMPLAVVIFLLCFIARYHSVRAHPSPRQRFVRRPAPRQLARG